MRTAGLGVTPIAWQALSVARRPEGQRLRLMSATLISDCTSNNSLLLTTALVIERCYSQPVVGWL